MAKKKIGAHTFVYPMPAFIIGSDVDGKPNFMVAAWSGIACSDPPMISVAFQPHRHTLKGVKAGRGFSVNVPPVSLMKQTDFCGIYGGAKEDKQATVNFDVFYGETKGAPMVAECPVNLECSVVMTLELGSHDLVIGKINEVHASEDVLDEKGKPDPVKIDPLIFSFSDRNYYKLGEAVGQAFKVGTELKKG